MLRIIGYARVSTTEQSDNSHALEQQEDRLKVAGATEIWTDIQSGSSNKRPNFQKLFNAVERQEIDGIIATRIDRLARSLPNLRELSDLCIAKNVNLRILDQHIDLSTPHGKLMLNLLGSVAEWERDLLISRVQSGLKYHRQEKRAPGIVPFGYIRRNDKYLPNLEQYRDAGKTHWEVAREVIEVFLSVQTIRRTARLMGERYPIRTNNKGGGEFADFPRENGLKHWLKSPVIRGHLAYYYRTRDKQVEIVPNQHERLISETEAAEIDRVLDIPTREKPFADRLPLTGIIYCAICNRKARAFRYHRSGKLIVRWYCSGIYAVPPSCVKAPGIRNELLTTAVIEALGEKAEEIANMVEGDSQEITDSEQILKLRESLDQLNNIPENEVIKEAKLKTINQIASLRVKLNEEQSNIKFLKEELKEIFRDPGFWLFISDDSKRRLFRKFIDKIFIQLGKVVKVSMRI